MRIRPSPSLLAALLILGGAEVAAAAPVRVALLPVTVHSSDAGSDYLSAGLASMLSSRLEQFDDVVVIRLDDAKDAGGRRESAVEVARTAGAQFVVYGSFTQFGEGASLDLQCASAGEDGADARRIFVQSGTLGEIIPKLDELAEKIHLHVSGGYRTIGSTAAPASGGSDLASLESRVEALERTVFRAGPEQGPATPPAPKPAAGGGATRPR